MGRSGPRKPKTREKEKEARVANVAASKPKSGALEKPSVALLQRARNRRPKPYLRVPNLPDPPPPTSDDDNGPPPPDAQQPLPKAETIYRNHLYNQSLVSGW